MNGFEVNCKNWKSEIHENLLSSHRIQISEFTRDCFDYEIIFPSSYLQVFGFGLHFCKYVANCIGRSQHVFWSVSVVNVCKCMETVDVVDMSFANVGSVQ